VVVSKAGKKTHGMGRFYSSIAQRPIPNLSFFALSLIDVPQRRSYPIALEQHRPVVKAAKAPEPVSQAAKGGRGRPKGSKNHAKTAPTLSTELTLLQSLLRVVLNRIAPLPVKHLVLDGYFDTYPASWVVRECGT
jgi:putative transposase